MIGKHSRRSLLIVTVIGVTLIVVFEFAKGFLEERFGLSYGAVARVEIGSVAALVLLVMNLVFHFSSIQAENAQESIREHVETFGRILLTNIQALEGRITLLRSSQLYSELTLAAASAEARIYTSYFGERPPEESPLKQKQDYFERVLSIPKRKKSVLFRRIVLFSSANAEWISALAKEYAGHPNMSLAVYRDMPDAVRPVSVQLFDESRLFLIRVADRPPGQTRDIEISARDVVLLFDDYYESVWQLSTVLVDAGHIDSAALSSLLRVNHSKEAS